MSVYFDKWSRRLAHRLKHQSVFEWLHLDAWLLLWVVLLAFYGLLILYSASESRATLLWSQAQRMCAALMILVLAAQVPPRYYRTLSWAGFILSVALLILVLLFGHTSKGAQRWISLAGIRFQPTEMLKLSIPMMLAALFGDRPIPAKPKDLCLALALSMIPALLVAKQPDLGSALVLIAIAFSGCFLAGLPIRWIGWGLLGGLMLAPLLWLKMHDYQRQRVMTFLDPEADPLGHGYHILQSIIAIGSGGLTGKGLLQGTQAHLAFLPEHATDFIFAVLGEELGFMGALLMVGLVLCITVRAFWIALQAKDTYRRLLSGMLAFGFMISAFINMAMVSGLLPVVGVPLPLVSYGGSAQLTWCAAFGLLMSMHRHKSLIER